MVLKWQGNISVLKWVSILEQISTKLRKTLICPLTLGIGTILPVFDGSVHLDMNQIVSHKPYVFWEIFWVNQLDKSVSFTYMNEMCAHDPKVVVLKVNVTGLESKKEWVCKGKNMHARGLATKKN